MKLKFVKTITIGVCLFFFSMEVTAQKKFSEAEIESIKARVSEIVRSNQKLSQVMVDKIFSFAELGFQEQESSAYLTNILENNGFEIERGYSGISTAWIAKWSNGDGPVIALGSDVDCIPKASQYPGVAFHKPIVEGAPGHGEGHNAGIPLNITAALAVQQVMKEYNIRGTLLLWPGIAEELVASKAWFVRDGMFKEIDACIFTHVSNNMSVSWGASSGTGLISVEFTFEGEAAHAAGAPWRGKSAADATELMNIGWNYKREHLNPLKRSHSIISDGGDQPNVVPSKSSIWYYFRDVTYEGIIEMYEAAINIAKGAALMTDTKMSYKILGTAWPRHFNKSIAETMYKNIEVVGLPQWSEEDQLLAKAVQKELGNKKTDGLAVELSPLGLPVENPRSGGSDDIGDVSWTIPTVTLRFPSNIPGLPGHHWANAISMATPIAHKGVTAGAQVEAMTLIDMFTNPQILEDAWTYFNEEQTKDTKYQPMIESDTEAPTYLNTEIDKRYRPELKKFFYDEKNYDSYLEQLGVSYPTLKKE
ncbi:MAG: peptidase dimerization domain-containing protein [Saprospiraceae bacterium]|jgi:aminobenzoyl-glutamate utilization protein B